jgi:hypothetical protein
VAQQPNAGLDHLTVVVSRSHAIETQIHPVGLLRTSDQPVAEDSNLHNAKQTQEGSIQAASGSQTRDIHNQEAADLSLELHGSQKKLFWA